MSYTKGPWCKDFGGSIGHIKSVASELRSTPTVCRYDINTPSISDEEKQANANLMSAAPELLEALKQIVFDWDGEEEDMFKAREAIAKAEGTPHWTQWSDKA